MRYFVYVVRNEVRLSTAAGPYGEYLGWLECDGVDEAPEGLIRWQPLGSAPFSARSYQHAITQ